MSIKITPFLNGKPIKFPKRKSVLSITVKSSYCNLSFRDKAYYVAAKRNGLSVVIGFYADGTPTIIGACIDPKKL